MPSDKSVCKQTLCLPTSPHGLLLSRTLYHLDYRLDEDTRQMPLCASAIGTFLVIIAYFYSFEYPTFTIEIPLFNLRLKPLMHRKELWKTDSSPFENAGT